VCERLIFRSKQEQVFMDSVEFAHYSILDSYFMRIHSVFLCDFAINSSFSVRLISLYSAPFFMLLMIDNYGLFYVFKPCAVLFVTLGRCADLS